ncbi:MAG TPA: alpha/beta hydrolase [Verrucomicrobiae bacterium]|jgi:esterase FrsA|nr:alpha/beta hydrolase [Verrucomicrobiae bacterium]
MTRRNCFTVLFILAVFVIPFRVCLAQDIAPPRTLDELKEETLKRVQEKPQRSMVEGILLEDAKAALASLRSLDRDEWAAAWITFGDRYMSQAKALEAAGNPTAKDIYLRAYAYYKLGHYPTENSPKKKEAYKKGIDAFLSYARYLKPRLEVVRIPFEGKEIIGYLRLPDQPRPAPLVYLVTALDSRKEEWAVRNGLYLDQGIGIFVTDMPGTAQAPIKGDPTAERMLSRAIDYLQTRPEIDPKRIAFYGGSWSGYYAAKMAIVERERLKAVVAQGVGVHHYFSPEWQRKALGTREYLMDLFAARSSVYGVTTLDDFLAYGPKMSLVTLGLIDKPSAPTLLVNGERDEQVPIEDLHLLLRHGSPKEAWVNPQGGHMGRGPGWSSQRIQRDVTVPWMVRMLKGDPVLANVKKSAQEGGGE